MRRELKVLMNEELHKYITTDCVFLSKELSVLEAKQEFIKQAEGKDYITMIYVVDVENRFCGVIPLKDLLVATEREVLEDLIKDDYPYLLVHDEMEDSIDKIKSDAKDSLPVVDDDGKLVGVLTTQDIIEVLDDEMSEDYVRLAGLTSEEDLKETTLASMKKRLPWLLVLLFLGMGVSTVVGVFEEVVAMLPIVICFQSLILDMAGNVGTQSLAVTIRILVDEEVGIQEKLYLIIKEVKVGASNGLLLGGLSIIFLGIYIVVVKELEVVMALLIAGCVGVSLFVTMIMSSLVGTLVPLIFHRIGGDPAVASGPLITTVNDLIAVITYYGLAWVGLIRWMHMG